jgi:addiction module RelE/StbE family toxin
LIVRFSAQALIDLDEIDEYIAAQNPIAASRQIATLLAAAAHLPEAPRQGRVGQVAGTRELVVTGTNYVLIYQVAASAIDILRVWHGRRAWPPR